MRIQALDKTLKTIIEESPSKGLPKSEVFKLSLQILNRLQRFHEIGFYYGDLSLNNILIGKEDP